MRVRRGEIYLADLDPVQGHEQGGIRPVLVIQNERGNKYSPTTIVACVTSKAYKKTPLPTHYYLPESIPMFEKSVVLLEQIKVIDKDRLHKRIGRLSKGQMKAIDKRLLISLGMNYYKSNKKTKIK